MLIIRTRVTVNPSGFSARDKDDHETAARAAFIYGSLYASIKLGGAAQLKKMTQGGNNEKR